MNTEKLNRWLALGANVGVLIGLILLVYEVRQNSELMQAQISMERTNTNMQILADFANGGDLIPIDVKLREQVDGFPGSLGWSGLLTAEEKRRYEFAEMTFVPTCAAACIDSTNWVFHLRVLNPVLSLPCRSSHVMKVFRALMTTAHGNE